MKRSRVGVAQMTKLLDLLSEDGVLINGKVNYSRTTRQMFWKRIALQLNPVENGVQKNAGKWCKMWADWKTNTKRKAEALQRAKYLSNGQQRAELTDLELRLLKLIKFPIEAVKAEDLEVEMVSEIPETSEFELPVFLTKSHHAELGQDPIVSEDDDEDKATIEHVATSIEHRTSTNVDNDNTVNEGDSEDDGSKSSDPEKKVKTKGKKFKKKNATMQYVALEEFKIRTTLELEKERVQQKSEELRLRALELKLKGEELRLKETEMNKINYLTHMEDEKLKCFKDISSSLKEFLDRTKNGNMRFHNVM